MPDLLELSARIIDSGVADVPTNRVTQELSEVARRPGRRRVVLALRRRADRRRAGRVRQQRRRHRSGRRRRAARLDRRPGAHARLHPRARRPRGRERRLRGRRRRPRGAPSGGGGPQRCAATAGPLRPHRRLQPGGQPAAVRLAARRRASAAGGRFLPAGVLPPDRTYDTELVLDVGGERVELHHARGETDDHTWAWLPARRAVCAGDFFIWNFPNAGNPQKVQRYPDEWAAALREMAAKQPELLLPAHGLPIGGAERVAGVLDETADVLDDLVEQVLALDERRRHARHRPAHRAGARRAPWRGRTCARCTTSPSSSSATSGACTAAGGTATPARLKPAPDADVAGRGRRPRRRRRCARGPRPAARRRTATCAWPASSPSGPGRPPPTTRACAPCAPTVYEQRHRQESSLMAKGIYRTAAQGG